MKTLFLCRLMTILTTLIFFSAILHATQNQQQYTISGIVRDATNGEVVIGISVFLVSDTTNITANAVLRGARTNRFGFYSLADVPVREQAQQLFLVVRGVGYKTTAIKVGFQQGQFTQTLNVELPTYNARAQEINVVAERGMRESVQSISRVELSVASVKKLPSIGGEQDVFRILQLLPGIQTSGELSSGLFVRGGSNDQNLTLLDGAIVYNPSHLGGFFSTFNADALQDIRVYKGAFPAEYGGRLSSVIDLTMKEGSNKKVSGSATLSSLNLRGMVEGPIFSSNATFMVSARRMIYDWSAQLSAATMDIDPATLPIYYFYDFNAKVNYRISDNDRVYLSGYLGRDVFSYGLNDVLTLGLGWGNSTLNARWMHILSPTIFTNFSLIYTNYDYTSSISTAIGNKKQEFSTLSRIQDFTARGEAQWLPNAQHTIKTGFEATRHTFTTSVGIRSDDSSATSIGENSSSRNQLHTLEAAAYIQDEWAVTPEFFMNIGLRLSWFESTGRIGVEPRISGAYTVNEYLTLKGSFAMGNQYVHLLTRNDISLPSDTWLPATRDILPSNTAQATFGAETHLFDNEYSVSIEGYYKTMNNLYEYRDGTILGTLDVNRLTEQLTRGAGESYGAEFLLERKVGDLTGWIGYTLSWATRTFPELNGGKPFAPLYDKRHNISIAATYHFDNRWEFGAVWTYQSGQPITLPSAQADFAEIDPNSFGKPRQTLTPTYNFTERNGFRMPSYHRLDLSATLHSRLFGRPCEYFVSVYNVYNNMNPFAWIITTNQSESLLGQSLGNIPANRPIIQQITIFPILPTIGVSLKF